MPRNGERIPKSESTRLKLLGCAVAEILDNGPDRVGFTAIAKRAGLSTGALYARYENADELLIDVWLHECLPTVRQFLSDAIDASIGDNRNASQQALSRSINDIPPSLAVAVSLMVVSHRNETLAEVIVPSFRRLMSELEERMPHAAMLVSQYFGQLILIRGTGMNNLDWSRVVRVLSDISAETFEPKIPSDLPDFGQGPFNFDLDDIDASLFEAVEAVIASVGVDKATISRIARKAGINPASIYMRYEDKEVMLERAVQVVYLNSTLRNADMLGRLAQNYQSNSAASALMRASAADSNRQQRLLRLEVLHSAAHHEYLLRCMRTLYEGAIARDVIVQERRSPTALDAQRPYTLFIRANFFGVALMRELGYLSPDDPYMQPYLDRLTARMTKSAEKLAALTKSELLQ
jgi:AcrR family transcriptional regulator